MPETFDNDSAAAFCRGCDYAGWEGDDSVSLEEFFGKLGTLGIRPTGEGKVSRAVGSPFRVPLPTIVKLCCIDEQMCQKAGVSFGGLGNLQETSVVLNQARNDVFIEAGLPGVETPEAS